jgi:hypothetical protein
MAAASQIAVSRLRSVVHPYDVAADGRRFVMLKPFDTLTPPRQLHLISNGLDQLFREISGTGKGHGSICL